MSKTVEERVTEYLSVENDLSLKLDLVIDELKDSIPPNQLCEFSRPNAKEPFFCKSPAQLKIEFFDSAYLCKIHYVHFFCFVVPFIQED